MHRHRCMSHMTHIPCRLLCNETCSYHAVVRWHRNGFPKPIPHSTQWTWTVASSQSLTKHMALLTCIIHVRWRAQAHRLEPPGSQSFQVLPKTQLHSSVPGHRHKATQLVVTGNSILREHQ